MILYRFYDPEMAVGSYWSEDIDYAKDQARQYLLELSEDSYVQLQQFNTEKVFSNKETGFNYERVTEVISEICLEEGS